MRHTLSYDYEFTIFKRSIDLIYNSVNLFNSGMFFSKTKLMLAESLH